MKYKQMNQKDFDYLTSIVGIGNISFNDQIENDFAHDELGTIEHAPEAHLYITNKNQVSDVMRYANEQMIPVTVRGTGTGLVGACVPLFGGILLDMSKMNKIIELDPVNMTLKVEPGVLLFEIYEYVEKENFFYGPDPGEKSATIGGNISTNAGGMRAVKYGVTRDWIRGLEIVLPSGDLISTGGKVVKNSSGYSIKDLIIGSEGTLGIVVEATLKLIPLPKHSLSLLIPFSTAEEAIHAVPEVIALQSLPTAVEFMDHQALQYSEIFLGKKIPNANYDAYLLVSFDGNSQVQTETDIDAVSKECIESLGALDAFLIDTDERKTSVWSARGAFLEAIKASTSQIDECDVVLPRSKITEFLSFTKEVSEKLEVRIPYFGHAGDGNLHIYFCKDELDTKNWEIVLQKGFKMLYDKAYEMGGLTSGEHGIGYAKKEFLKQQVGNTQMQLMEGIKKVFDPNDILNPGKIV